MRIKCHLLSIADIDILSETGEPKSAVRTIDSISIMLLAASIFLLTAVTAIAEDGDPIAIRCWPGSGSSIETMWNLHVAMGVDHENRSMMPRTADVEFLDDFWEASGCDHLVLDRKPNETQATLKPFHEYREPSSNAVHFSRVVLRDSGTGNAVFLNRIAVDGVTIVDSNQTPASQLAIVLQGFKEVPIELRSIDVFMIEDASAEPSAYQTLLDQLKPRVMLLRDSVKFDQIGQTPVMRMAHNTFAISKSKELDPPKCVALAETPWKMQTTLADLFSRKEAACKSSRGVFAALTIPQLNFRPSNGTHTPRWNCEHMMGRELLFFSQIYHAVDSNIPVMDRNPKQMPPDYRPAHIDWTGVEESLQMERVEAFTRRFAYMLDGMDLDRTAIGSSFWTPRALLKQLETHYTDHTANVIKKRSLPDWPKE